MRILVVSDSHYFNDQLTKILDHYKNNVDLIIHCGDSSLDKDDSILNHILCVEGNHDHSQFPNYIIHNNILITHGHLYNIYNGYDELIQLCKDNHCHICFHGHTHIPSYQVIDNIHFINPGSTMINRGSYGFGSFSIVDILSNSLNIHFYRNDNFENCDYVLKEGLDLLEELKEFVTKNK